VLTVSVAAILCLLLAGNIYILAARLIFRKALPKVFGFAALAVASGSMQPVVNVGDLIIIREQTQYSVNDIVTYNSGRSIVTHRIVELDDNEAVVKGDAKQVADGSIPLSSIEGRVVFRSLRSATPCYCKSPYGVAVVIAGVVLLGGLYLPVRNERRADAMEPVKGRVQLYLVYLLVVTFILTGISLSRFSTAISLGGSAKVARAVFEYVPVSALLNGEPIPIADGLDISDALPGDELVYNFEIRNFDEDGTNQVLLKYRVSVTFDPEPSALPLSYEVTPQGSYPAAGDGWVYMDFGEPLTHAYSLTVNWDENDIDPAHLSQEQPIQIEVVAEQVDSRD
jgi:signal peptidase